MNETSPAAPAADQRQVALQKIYLRDASVEVPLGAAVFTRQGTPKTDVRVDTAVDPLSNDTFQVALSVTVTARLGDQTLFLVEAKQAGVFLIQGFADEAERRAILGAYCPSVIFPFVRETVADLVQRAGFPPLLLQPVNFDALYAQHQAAPRPAAAAKQH
jgi:preprotein translocase subunit SecB